MFKIDKKQKIHITRGDIAKIEVSANTAEGLYTFQQDDVIRFVVMMENDVTDIQITKSVTVTDPTTIIEFSLTSSDTRLGDAINGPVTYWYEVELNPDTNPQTIIGYDESGAKEFILYPEGDVDDD